MLGRGSDIAKLLRPVGRTRGRYYVAEPVLLEEQKRIQATRAPKETSDPFELASGQLTLALSWRLTAEDD
jgi:hypothetical protein